MTQCEKYGRSCGVLAVYHDIVWRGPVTIPKSTTIEGHILRLVLRNSSSSTTTYTGRATETELGGKLRLRVKLKDNRCEGIADPVNGRWHLDCYGQDRIAGTIGAGTDNLLWGAADTEPLSITVSERKWPKLEAAITEHNLSFSSDPSSAKSPYGNKREIIVNWANVWGPFNGHLYTDKRGRVGDVTLRNREVGWRCRGKFSIADGTSGSWNMDCGDGGKVSGTITVDGDKYTGTGWSQEGYKVTLKSK